MRCAMELSLATVGYEVFSWLVGVHSKKQSVHSTPMVCQFGRIGVHRLVCTAHQFVQTGTPWVCCAHFIF